jgi:hypothetical protein
VALYDASDQSVQFKQLMHPQQDKCIKSTFQWPKATQTFIQHYRYLQITINECRRCRTPSRKSALAKFRLVYLRADRGKHWGWVMAQITIVYWRDIPAQVIVKQGRTAAKRQLAERFEQAIDRCAMKVGASDADAYMEEWRRGEPVAVEGDLEEIAAAEAARLETQYDNDQIKVLIANNGWATALA